MRIGADWIGVAVCANRSFFGVGGWGLGPFFLKLTMGRAAEVYLSSHHRWQKLLGKSKWKTTSLSDVKKICILWRLFLWIGKTFQSLKKSNGCISSEKPVITILTWLKKTTTIERGKKWDQVSGSTLTGNFWYFNQLKSTYQLRSADSRKIFNNQSDVLPVLLSYHPPPPPNKSNKSVWLEGGGGKRRETAMLWTLLGRLTTHKVHAWLWCLTMRSTAISPTAGWQGLVVKSKQVRVFILVENASGSSDPLDQTSLCHQGLWLGHWETT